MYTEIKRFLNHSIVYFVGNALNRLDVFLLLPLYTNYFTPGGYGTLELIFVMVAFVRVFLGMRLSSATLRFFYEYETENDKKRVVSTSLLSIILWCLLLTIILISFSKQLSMFVFKSDAYSMLLILGFCGMFFEVTSEIPLAFLRAKDYSVLYVLASLSHLIIRVGLNVYIVIYLHKGVEGILIGNLISSFLLWSFLCVFVFKSSGIAFDISKLRALWKYSYPLVIASLPGLILGNADRLFLGWYASLEVVGIYALAIRFGMALEGFVLEPFQLGYSPFRFSIMKQENAKEVYARILTYFLFLAAFIGLFVTLLSREVIELMASESFRNTYKIVPLIVFSTLVRGVAYIFQTGLLIEKRTGYMPYISISTAILNVLTLFFFVPLFGIYGAAFSLVITSFLDVALNYMFSQRCYHISFEYQRVIKIAGVAFFIYFLSILTNGMSFSERLLAKIGMIIVFPFLLIPLRFYTKEEIEKLFVLREKISMKVFSTIGVNRR